MRTDRLLKLHPAVFYRSSGEKTTLYQTAKGKVYGFDGIASDVLGEFGEKTAVDQAISNLEALYGEAGNEGLRQDITRFVDQLAEEGILLEEFSFDAEPSKLKEDMAGYESAPCVPETVTIEATYRCNEKCRHCYIPPCDGEELSTDELRGIIDQLAKMGTFNIVFTGGEFFVRKDAFELLEHAYEKHLLIDVFTNGIGLDAEAILKLKAVWPRCAHFSLYSHVPAKHDAVTRVEGSFARTLEAVRRCSMIGIPVNIKAPIFLETLEDAEGLIELARDMRATIEIGGHVTPRKNGDLAPTSMGIQTERDYLRLKEVAVRAFGNHKGELLPLANGSTTERGEALCSAGQSSLCIGPFGDVYPCALFQLPLGNVRKQAIKEIWASSPNLLWWREHNRRTCRVGCGNCELADRCAFCPGEALMRAGSPLARYGSACAETAFNKIWEQEGR